MPSNVNEMLDPTLSTFGHQQQLRAESQATDAGRSGVPQYEKIAAERAQTWTGLDRFAFNAMLAAPNTKNKLRLKREKLDRIIYFLTTPDAKSREKDRADAQTKHQAQQQWIYRDGILYRKESRLQQPRQHVSEDEVFDVLTAEHLKSGHHGRDKMLKILESKYIGYTKDELMFVLDRCSVCSSKQIRGAAARRRENRQSGALEVAVTTVSKDVDPNLESINP